MNSNTKAAIVAAVNKALEVPLPESEFAVEFKSVTARVHRDKNTRKEYADASASYSLRTFAGVPVEEEINSHRINPICVTD